MDPTFQDYNQLQNMQGVESMGALSGGLLIGLILVYLVVLLVLVVSMWKIFSKAGKPGWASLIPIYNLVVLLEIVGRPVWWLVLMLLPLVNVVIGIIVLVDLAKSFGKGVGYALGLLFFGIIFYPMLAFGSAQYRGPAAKLPGAV